MKPRDALIHISERLVWSGTPPGDKIAVGKEVRLTTKQLHPDIVRLS